MTTQHVRAQQKSHSLRLRLPSSHKTGFIHCVKTHPMLYVMLFPSVAFMIIFKYIPMYGIILAFKDWDIVKGIFGSPWIGFENFNYLFHSKNFLQVFRTSIEFSMIRLFWCFPAPIFLALMINEIRVKFFKRSVQTLLYLPHFISWVIIAGLVMNFTTVNNGVINEIIKFFGGKPIAFLQSKRYFRSVIVIAEIWKGAGWGTIIYLAALSGIDQELYEAAIVDGASRIQRILHITLPGISNTIAVLLIMRTGGILSNGFEQIYMLYSPLVYQVADVFETYSYRIGLAGGRFSYGTAIGLFTSLVGIILIFTTNHFSRKIGGRGMW